MADTLGFGSISAFDATFIAAEVMANKYVAVKLNTVAGEVALAGDGEMAVGILQDTAAAVGDSVRVRMPGGTTLVKANGAFAINDLLNSAAATGFVDTKGATEHAIALALEAATAQNDEVLALVRHVYV